MKEKLNVMKKRISFSNFLYLVLVIMFSCSISHILTGKLSDGITFIIFQVLFLLLPGFIVSRLFHVGENQRGLYNLTCAYFAGYLFNMVCYLLIVPFGLQKYTNLILGCFVIVLCIIAHKRKLFGDFCVENNAELFSKVKDSKNEIVVLIVFSLVIIFQLVLYVGSNMMPPRIQSNVLYNDVLYWMGNTIELQKEFPPKNFRFYPEPYNYHYFSSLQLALVGLSTGIRATYIGFGFTIIQATTMCVLGAWLFIQRMIKIPVYRLIALIATFFTSGIENITCVAYSVHMYWGMFGFDYGLAWFCLFWAILCRMCQESDFKKKDAVLIWLLILVMSGTKASFGAVAIVGLGVICFIWLFKGKQKQAFIIGIPPLVIFVLAYVFVLNIKGYGGSIENVVHLSTMYDAYPQIAFGRDLVSKVIPLGRLLPELIFNIGYLLLCHPLAFGLCAYSIIFHKEKLRELDWGLLAAIFVGVFINMYMFMNGSSNTYFMMATYPLALLFGMHFLKAEKVEKKYKFDFALVTLLFIVSIVGWSLGYRQWTLGEGVKKGMENIFTQRNNSEQRGANISADQYEALNYIYERADEDTIITTNGEYDLVIGVVTECYNVDCNLYHVKDNEQVDVMGILEQIKSKNVKYIIRYKDNQWALPPTEGLMACYENEKAIVYEVLKEKL